MVNKLKFREASEHGILTAWVQVEISTNRVINCNSCSVQSVKGKENRSVKVYEWIETAWGIMLCNKAIRVCLQNSACRTMGLDVNGSGASQWGQHWGRHHGDPELDSSSSSFFF